MDDSASETSSSDDEDEISLASGEGTDQDAGSDVGTRRSTRGRRKLKKSKGNSDSEVEVTPTPMRSRRSRGKLTKNAEGRYVREKGPDDEAQMQESTPVEIEHPSKVALTEKIKSILESQVLVDLTQETLDEAVVDMCAPYSKYKPREGKQGRKRKSEAVTEGGVDDVGGKRMKDTNGDSTMVESEEGGEESEAADVDQPGAAPKIGEGATAQQRRTITVDNDAHAKVFRCYMDGTRYKCCIPNCNKTFLNLQGLKYHCHNHVHEVIDFLCWAYPADPVDESANPEAARSNPPSSEKGNVEAPNVDTPEPRPATTTTDEPTKPPINVPDFDPRMAAIRPDIRTLMNDIPYEAWDIFITDYPTIVPGSNRPTALPYCIGLSKERRLAVKKELKQIAKREEQLERQALKAQKDTGKKPKAGQAVDGRRKRRRKLDLIHHVVPDPRMVDWNERSSLETGVMYESVRPQVQNFELVDAEEAAAYIPLVDGVTLRSGTKAKSDESTYLPTFKATPLGASSKRPRVVLNAGGSVWGLGWCPGVPSNEAQYLAVAGYKRTIDEHHVVGMRQTVEDEDDPALKGCIQIWRIGVINDAPEEGASGTKSEVNPELVMCLLHEWGCVHDLKWAPYGYYESPEKFEKAQSLESSDLPRLGLLAVSFGDGGTRVLNVPHPSHLTNRLLDKDLDDGHAMDVDEPASRVLFARVKEPLFEALLPDGLLWKIAWGGIERIAMSCTNGNLAVYTLRHIMKAKESDRKGKGKASESSDVAASSNGLRSFYQDANTIPDLPEPIFYFPSHDSCARDMTWIDQSLRSENENADFPPPAPNLLVSTGSDGRLMLHDVRDPWMGMMLYRVRAFMHSLSYVPELNGIAMTDGDSGVRFLRPGDEDPFRNKNKAVEEDDIPGIFKNQRTLGLLQQRACIWSLDTSKYLPFTASASADGTVLIVNSQKTELRLHKNNRHKALQTALYKLEWDYVYKMFKFVEGFLPEDPGRVVQPRSGGDHSAVVFYPPEVAIQKVKYY
ncbi:hypothetical protein HK104_005080 [Borealophlyctis nickersoniae]|nr:hypothetical protein HK104_005080 [Borealophlyctis nickersoniae]